MKGSCPVCRRQLKGEPAELPELPFCSERCRLVDLGQWLDGGYRISEPGDESVPEADDEGTEPSLH